MHPAMALSFLPHDTPTRRHAAGSLQSEHRRTPRSPCSATSSNVLRRQVKRPEFRSADRALQAMLSSALSSSGRRRCCGGTGGWWRVLDLPALPVRPAAIGQGRRAAHRPPGQGEPRWGYQRIEGEFLHLGVSVSATGSDTRRRHGVGRRRGARHRVTGAPAPAGCGDRCLRLLCATKAEGGIDVEGRSERCCTRDGGGPSGAALQGEAPNHRKLRRSRAGVVSVAEKARRECVRCEPRRRTRVNH